MPTMTNADSTSTTSRDWGVLPPNKAVASKTAMHRPPTHQIGFTRGRGSLLSRMVRELPGIDIRVVANRADRAERAP